MLARPLRFATGLALANVASAAETGTTSAPNSLSPIRQYLRESIKAQLPVKPAEPTPANLESKTADAPVLLPTVRVTEKPLTQVFDEVNAMLAQQKHQSSAALFKTDRLDVLQSPRLDDVPARDGTPRLKLTILQFTW